jgi:2-oxoglutarate ferredoxin oxidoreductase subunit delta
VAQAGHLEGLVFFQAGSSERNSDMKPRINVVWNEDYCKRCILCVEVCPVQVLSLEMDEIVEKDGCIRCYQCERYCPDIAIEVMDQGSPTGKPATS